MQGVQERKAQRDAGGDFSTVKLLGRGTDRRHPAERWGESQVLPFSEGQEDKTRVERRGVLLHPDKETGRA